jgi:hypothetical protein
MSQFRLPGRQPFEPFDPATVERPSLSEPATLRPEMLEHGAYYSGKIGGAPAVARWHATKQRFVFGEFSLGRQHIRSIAHVVEKGTGERFAPLSKSVPKETGRISDYAFETIS